MINMVKITYTRRVIVNIYSVDMHTNSTSLLARLEGSIMVAEIMYENHQQQSSKGVNKKLYPMANALYFMKPYLPAMFEVHVHCIC